MPAAREHTEQAWAKRDEAPHNIIPRILWLQLAGVLLDGDAAGVAALLGLLKTALMSEDAIMKWDMARILALLQPKLAPDNHALLTALVAAMSFPEKLAEARAIPRLV